MTGVATTEKQTGRSIWAVVAGFLSVAILSLATDQVLHVLNVYPPWGQPMWDNGLNALALSYRVAYTVFGGWLTARLAPRNPLKHAVILGAIGTVPAILGVFGAMAMKMGPVWYPIGIVVTGLPSCWLGGRFFVRRRSG